MKAYDARGMFLIVVVTLGLAFVLTQWQTKTLRDEMARLLTQQQTLEHKLEAETERRVHTLIKLRNAEATYERANRAFIKLENVEAELSVVGKSLEEARSMVLREPGPVTLNMLHITKRGFNDIQHQVAAGRFPGLALTDGYMEMKKILDNPAFEEMLASDHGISSR